MAYEIRERSRSEILQAAFLVCRDHVGVCLGVALSVVLPSALIVSLLNWLVTGSIDSPVIDVGSGGASDNGSPELAETMRGILASALGGAVQLFCGVLQDAVLTITIADIYLGRPVSVRSGFQKCFSMLGSFLGASVLKTLGILLGFLCFIIPGVLLVLRWILSTPAIAVEERGALDSLRRSRELTADNYIDLLLLLLTFTIIGMALLFGMRAILPDAVERMPVLAQLLQYVPQLLVAPVSSAAITLAYFDLRVRNEGLNRERLAPGLGEVRVSSHGA